MGGLVGFASGFPLYLFGSEDSDDNLVDVGQPVSIKGLSAEEPASDSPKGSRGGLMDAKGSTSIRVVVPQSLFSSCSAFFYIFEGGVSLYLFKSLGMGGPV